MMARGLVTNHAKPTVIFSIYLAKQSLRTWRTRTAESIDEVMARTTILARPGGAFIYIKLAAGSLVSRRTVARVPADKVVATGAVATWLRCALINIEFTVAPVITSSALTPI